MTVVQIELKPWDGQARWFKIEVELNGKTKTVTEGSKSEGSWLLYGNVTIHWVNDVYTFDTRDCETIGQSLIEYERMDPNKPDSISAVCIGNEQLPPTTSTAPVVPPEATPTTAPPTTADLAFEAMSGPPEAPTTAPESMTTGPAGYAGAVPGAILVNTESLPVTGINEFVIPSGLGLLVLGTALWLKFRNKAKPVSRTFHD